MFKSIGFGLILLISTINLYSCDVCGSSSIGGANMYNLENRKMIGITYAYGSSSYADHSVKEWSYTAHRNTINISSLWNVAKTLQAEINVPLEQNSRNYLISREQNSSLADIQLGLNHFQKLGKDSTNSWMLKSTILIEIPVMKLNDKFLKNMNMQSTSRSFDGIIGLGILKNWGDFRILANTKFKRSIVELIDYRFGDTWLNELTVMYTIKSRKELAIIPLGGLTKEIKSYDFEDELQQHGTASNNMFAKIGFQLSKNKWFLGATYSLPVRNKVIEKGVSFNSRINTFLIYTL